MKINDTRHAMAVIDLHRARENISGRALGELVGGSTNTFWSAQHATNVRFDTILKMARAVGLTVKIEVK